MLRVVRHVHDPFSDLARLTRADRNWLRFWLILALALHGAMVVAVPRAGRTPHEEARFVMEAFEIALPPAPEPSPTREPEPPPERSPVAAAPVARSRPTNDRAAGEVVTKLDDESQPIDLTDAVVTGSAATYAGGITSSAATATGKRGENAVGSSPRGGEATAGSIRPDASRRASIAGDSDWHCPFPSEADQAGVNSASSVLSVRVSRSGSAELVTVLSDPGYGFGAAARRCALGRRYIAAAGPDGRAISDVLVVKVRFIR